jgi:pimeloyl-ACP methyl ester carboxylesterase
MMMSNTAAGLIDKEILANHDQQEVIFYDEPDAHIPVHNGKVAYRCRGKGPDILFIHGWPVSSATFRDLLPSLEQSYTCHLIDLVGAGSSVFNTRTTIDLAAHIAAVGQLVESLGLQRFVVVGHDSGGLIARHALAGDDRVAGMVLINSEQPQGLSRAFKQLLMLRHVPRLETVLSFAMNNRLIRRSGQVLGGCFTDRNLIDGAFARLFLEPLKHDANRRWAAAELLRKFDTGFVDELTAIHARIQVPVKLIWGEKDPFFPLSRAKEMVDTFADASLTVIPDTKLFCHEEMPDKVAEFIASFGDDVLR